MDSEAFFGGAHRPLDAAEPRAHKWLVAAAVLLGGILTILDASIVNVALPYMQRSFNVGVSQISWVVTSYLAAVGVMIPMAGWMAARIGRRRYLIISIVLFIIASALCGVSRSMGQILVFRLLQGAAGAAMMPLAQAILLETFPVEEHTLAMTTFGIGMMAAPVLGPTVGGWITQNLNWRWNFYINVPIGAFAALMVYTYVHDPAYLRQQRRSGKIDYLGILLITAALGLFQLVIGRGGQDGWFAARWVCYAAALCGLSAVTLVIHELRFPEPIVDLRIFADAGFSIAVILISLQGLALWIINLLNPLFLENVLHYDAWRAGLIVAPRGLGVVVALVATGQLSRRLSDIRPLVCAGMLLAAYEAYRMSCWTFGMRDTELLLPIFLFGLGLGGVFPVLTALGMGQMPRERMGFASSLFSMMINTGAAAGIAIATNLLTSRRRWHQAKLLASLAASHNAVHGVASRAWLLAYNDVYRMTALLLFVLVPGVFLLKRASPGEKLTAAPD